MVWGQTGGLNMRPEEKPAGGGGGCAPDLPHERWRGGDVWEQRSVGTGGEGPQARVQTVREPGHVGVAPWGGRPRAEGQAPQEGLASLWGPELTEERLLSRWQVTALRGRATCSPAPTRTAVRLRRPQPLPLSYGLSLSVWCVYRWTQLRLTD